MKRTITLLILVALMCPFLSYGQEKAVTGSITTSGGEPVPAASVQVAGTGNGTVADPEGHFTINAAAGDTLIISSVSYEPKKVVVGTASHINVTLSANTRVLQETVVTALGISRQQRSLSYSLQTVDNSALTKVQNANLVNNLSGRVAGVNITRSSSGIGGSVRVVIRGNKSTRENQPLYVIDGVPMPNPNPAQPGDEWGQALGFVGIDGGDAISNLSPDDIASITVLKGASAAALYGSQAANGAILITTKKGRAGQARISLSSEVTFNTPLYEEPLQFEYGQTAPATGGKPGSRDSWGGKVHAPDHVAPFFQTGVTSFNSVSLSGGTDKAQSYFSYAYTSNKGIMPTSGLKKHNLNFHETAEFFNNRLTGDFNVMFTHEKADNRPVSGLYDNPLTGLYEFPRGLDFNKYKQYEVFSSARNTYVQNWWDNNYDSSWSGTEVEQNPYWLLHRNASVNTVDRIFSNLSFKYKINGWLTLQARGNVDKSLNDITIKSYATTSIVLTANNGGYTWLRAINTQLYGDLLLSADKKLTDNLGLDATIGSSVNDSRLDQTNIGTKNSGDGLRFANVFTLANILPEALNISQAGNHRQVQALFGTASLNWKQDLFLDLTARNDWSSTFAFTPVEKKGYFYYSAGASVVLSDLFRMGYPVSFSKVRVSYAKVGNDVPVYSTNPADYSISNQSGSSATTTGPKPGYYLKPEDNRSFEVGTNWRFFDDRIGIDFTWYENNNYNQYITIPVSAGTTGNLTTWYVNAGNIRNKGIEVSLSATPVRSAKVTWSTTVNYAMNRNKVIAIANAGLGVSQDYFTLTGIGNLIYASYIKQGGSWGDIYGHFFKRSADGAIIVDSTGVPQEGTDTTSKVGDQSLKKLGNANPKFTLGWSNTLQVGNFTLDVLFNGSFGGQVMSYTQAMLDGLGDSKATGDARNAGKVNIRAEYADGSKFTGTIDPKTFYQKVGGQSGIGEYYMYDATNIRLQELSLGYRIPVRADWINSLNVALVGRDLFLIKKAPFDPAVSMATNNGLQGIDTFGLPATRSIGVSVKVVF